MVILSYYKSIKFLKKEMSKELGDFTFFRIFDMFR
jgi:hypothetical protein